MVSNLLLYEPPLFISLNSNLLDIISWKKANNFETAIKNAKVEVLITVYIPVSNINHAIEVIIPKYSLSNARYVTGGAYTNSALFYVQIDREGYNLTIQAFYNGASYNYTTSIIYR